MPPRRPAGRISWPLVLGLGALALIRPLAHITGLSEVTGPAVAAVGLTLAVTATWVGVVGLGRVPRPVLTLTLAAVAYGLYTVVLSAVLSPILTGTLQGPAVMPFAVVPIVLTNAAWGAVAGVLAAGLQRLRGER